MIHGRPARSSSEADPTNLAAQRLGAALAAADITTPDRYQRLQADALRACADFPNGLDQNGQLTEKGMLFLALYFESAILPR